MLEKTLSTISVTTFVIISTAAFGYAEYTSADLYKYPYFQLGCMIIGGFLIISLKNKYSRLYVSEAVGAFALYTVMISLFTTPVIDLVAWLFN
ncbi:MAG: hypothetical protein JXA41_02040 [Deltaproteobacteria bacterium]|nr:hypothetical protein [Deltaproteobacteria bacterium]